MQRNTYYVRHGKHENGSTQLEKNKIPFLSCRKSQT